MTAAPPDIRALLDDLATQAPPLDLADAAVRGADHRRRRRRVAALAVVALGGLVAITLPTVVGPLTSGLSPAGREGQLQQYDPDVVTPWFGVDDLPDTLEEPVAMVLSGSGSGEPGGDDLVVTASGRVFRLAGSMWWNATVSPDGRVLVWYDTAEQAITSRDLRDGTTHQYRVINAQDVEPGDDDQAIVVGGYPSAWSPDGTLLALLADAPGVSTRLAIVLDVATGTDRHFELTETSGPPGYVDSVGWQDDDTLLFPRAGSGTTSFPITLLEIRIDGDGSVENERAAGSPPGSGQPFVIAPDQSALVSTSTGFPLIRRFDMATGTYEDFDCRPCTGALGMQWASPREIVVTPDSATDGYPLVPQAVDIDTGSTRPLAAISGREPPRQVVFARDLLIAGPAHDPHTSMWWPGWYLDWIFYIAAGLAAIVLAVTVAIRARRRPRSVDVHS